MDETNRDPLSPHDVLSEYYASETERRKVVDHMFDASAMHYDWINHMMSFGSGGWYRKQALQRVGVAEAMCVLDVGAGTGVISHLAQDIVGGKGLVVALDPSKGMLTQAKKRGVINVTQSLGERLPFQNEMFDVLTMGFALRHVADLRLLFLEFNRVLKPGGKILLLEVTRPESKWARIFLKLYIKGAIPTLTRLFRRSADAQKLMRYYWDTIEACVPPKTILAAMDEAGFSGAKRHVVQGIFSEYNGMKHLPAQG